VCEVLRVDEPQDGLVQRDARGDEDREHDCESREPLPAGASQKEGDAERDGGQCVSVVMDQVSKEGDRPGEHEDERLSSRSDREHGKANRDGFDAFTRPDDRAVYESVRVAVITVLVVVRMITPLAVAVLDRLGAAR
jgi:hypothetical protein